MASVAAGTIDQLPDSRRYIVRLRLPVGGASVSADGEVNAGRWDVLRGAPAREAVQEGMTIR